MDWKCLLCKYRQKWVGYIFIEKNLKVADLDINLQMDYKDIILEAGFILKQMLVRT